MRWLAPLLLLCGCTSYNQVEIEVSDTHALPIANAQIHTAPAYFFNPNPKSSLFLGAGQILWPFPGEGVVAWTDESGIASLRVVSGNPSAITVFADGHDQWRGMLVLKHGEAILQSANRPLHSLQVDVTMSPDQ
ncbi:MAG: hypothetical protein QGH76_09565 [Phycisphaerales bacterium]|jgi:hypothetical protein|nr:hypothetical protein [Phycisphaerales bacterium]